MIWKLLRKNISAAQIAGYAIANLIGLAIVLSAIQFYKDVSAALGSDDDSMVSKDYLVISQRVSTIASVLGDTNEFTDDDIANIMDQPWAVSVGRFTAADFGITGSVAYGGQGLSSLMFLESVPDEYLDVVPEDWGFNDQRPFAKPLPIIIPKDYLSLYNFGFAGTQGLPKVSEGTISMIPVNIYLQGNGHYDRMEAFVAGFSSRINTLAAPQTFMDWANDRYGTHSSRNPSRLIVKVRNPGDPAIMQYMDDHNYEVAGDKVDSGKAAYFLTILTGILITIGAIISALALFILILSITLLLQKNREKLRQLLLLGYSPAQVAADYYRLIVIVNAIVLALALIVMFAASAAWQSRMAVLGVEGASPLSAIIAAVAIMTIITAINLWVVRHNVLAAYHGNRGF